ncbi:MAG: hypothetical protein OQK51_03650 [Kangiellaceae bacterium]|nr:hypothetical protein [Kangiellaceae bacterium]
MDDLYFQDSKWDIPELVGKTFDSFFGLTYEGTSDNHPEILIFKVTDGAWYRCFLDAQSGFLCETPVEDLGTIVDCDYEGARRIDYLKGFSIKEQPIRKLFCEREGACTLISIQFDSGTVNFREFDDESRDGEIEFKS